MKIRLYCCSCGRVTEVEDAGLRFDDLCRVTRCPKCSTSGCNWRRAPLPKGPPNLDWVIV